MQKEDRFGTLRVYSRYLEIAMQLLKKEAAEQVQMRTLPEDVQV